MNTLISSGLYAHDGIARPCGIHVSPVRRSLPSCFVQSAPLSAPPSATRGSSWCPCPASAQDSLQPFWSTAGHSPSHMALGTFHVGSSHSDLLLCEGPIFTLCKWNRCRAGEGCWVPDESPDGHGVREIAFLRSGCTFPHFGPEAAVGGGAAWPRRLPSRANRSGWSSGVRPALPLESRATS